MTEPAVLPAIAALREEMVTLRRHIHAHPELGFEERRTAALVAECLEAWGYQVSRGVGRTGVVGTLVPRRGPSAGPARRHGRAADPGSHRPALRQPGGRRDARLRPRRPHRDAPRRARHLVESPHWRGTLQLIFQPAEEGLGGARAMLDDGLLERFPCDAIFAMHNVPGYPVGHLGFHPGPFMASADTVVIRVIGSGGHGAVPQRTVDPVVVCSAIVLALQSIVSRNVDPQDTAIVSVGAIHAGTVSNVIPASAEMILSVRALTAETRALLERRIGELARGQAASFGARAEVDYRHCHPVLVNHPGQTAFAREVARDWLGEECLIDGLRPFTASEDFAFILERCPGSYLVIGNGQGESGCQLHNPGYDFNDDCLAVGASYWVRLAERFLA